MAASDRAEAAETLRGYYAHIAALDDCVQTLLDALDTSGIAEDTLFVFTSDHGDMHLSHGLRTKHVPWDESIRVPFLLRYPRVLGHEVARFPVSSTRRTSCQRCWGCAPAGAADSAAGLLSHFSPRPASAVPLTLRGSRGYWRSAFLSVPASYGMLRTQGLPAYRGVRTLRYTYVRSTRGPWLLYDNETDPYQVHNLCGDRAQAAIAGRLEAELQTLARSPERRIPAGPGLPRTRWFNALP